MQLIPKISTHCLEGFFFSLCLALDETASILLISETEILQTFRPFINVLDAPNQIELGSLKALSESLIYIV